jgi:CRISPR-associated protein Csm1
VNNSIHSSNIYLASIKKVLTALSQNLARHIPIKETHEAILEQARKIAQGNTLDTCSAKYLSSIFDGLKKTDKEPKINYWVQGKGFQYHYQALSVEEKDFFPTKDTTPQYGKAKLLQDFENELKTITDKYSNDILAENIFNLCEKYLVNIPSPYDCKVSLFDFLKVQTAAAICLTQADNKEKEEFLVINADISGIQGFLFDIVSSKASANLKGRSLYLQLLPELVLHRILEDLGLFAPNVLYASGGGFTILAANTKTNRDKLREIRTKVSNALFEAHGIGLYLELGWVEASFEKLRINAKSIFKELKENEMAAQKRHKFSEQILAEKDFFEPQEVGGEQLRDAVTGEELDKKEKLIDLNSEYKKEKTYQEVEKEENSQPVKILTNYLIQQGKSLEENQYLVIKKTKTDLQPFQGIGFIYTIEDHTEGRFVFKIRDLENLNYLPNNLKTNTIQGFEFYGGNDFPKIKIIGEEREKTKTYSELGGQKETDRKYPDSFIEPKFKRLGILRMDVDGLGSVFINGFDSLVHYSTLSRNLDYFFKGYLNTIWATKTFAENQYFKDWLQIVYAGGDDIFVVGKWDAAIAFAKVVREDFKKFVCDNPNFGISGGVSLVTPKFPVIKAADYADKAESAAKAHKVKAVCKKVNDIENIFIAPKDEEDACANKGMKHCECAENQEDVKNWCVQKEKQQATFYKDFQKNAFSMMGETLNWDFEFPIVEYLKKQIVNFISNKYLPISFIYKVNGYYEETLPKKHKNLCDYQKEKAERRYGKWRWQIAYDLARMKERIKGNESASNFLGELINWSIAQKTPKVTDDSKKHYTIEFYTFFKLLNVACIWASYELRNKS